MCYSSSSKGVPETEKESKPRSLRFTWSMRTTSAMDPKDMMREIRVVSHFFLVLEESHSIISVSRY